MLKTSRIIIVLLFLTLALASTWFFSLREVRLKIGDYYFNQGNFDQAVNWYEKVVRKERLVAHQGITDQLKYKEDIFKLKSALVSLAKDHLQRISNSNEPDVSDSTRLDAKMREFEKITQLFENYRKRFVSNSEEVVSNLNEILNEIETKRVDFVLAFGGKYVQKNMWKEAEYFFTKRILGYMDPISTLEKLDRLYRNDHKIREKIWRGDIFVTLEDFEDTSKPILTDWEKDTEPTVNVHTISTRCSRTGYNSEYFDLSYKKLGYDYWGKPVNIPLTNPNLSLGVRFFIKSDAPPKGILKINVSYPKQKVGGVWQTDTRKDIVNGWEERRIENLYQKAQMIASEQSWDMTDMAIDRIILDTEGFPNRFYVDDIELFITRN